MHERNNYGGYASRYHTLRIPYLETGKTKEEKLRFRRIAEEARPHTKGLREREFVEYYDIETVDYADIIGQRETHREQLEELSATLRQLAQEYNVTINLGNHDRG